LSALWQPDTAVILATANAVMNSSSPTSLAPKPQFGGAPEANIPLQILATTLKVFGCVVLVLVLAVALQSPMGFRLIAAGSIFLLLILLIWKTPTIGVVCTFAFLVILGGVRRWLIPDFGWFSYDPLIIIAPALTITFFFSLVISRKVPSDTQLSRCIKFLLLVMALQILNPLQGGLLVGFGGILFYLAPMLWFYIGRRFGTPKIALVLFQSSVFIFILTALYGMKQVLIGISASEQAWVEASGYAALAISDNTIRVFSTFASTQEYAATLAFAITVCTAFMLQRKVMFFFPLILLVPALFYTGTRGPVVAALFTVCVQWAFMGRNRATWVPRLGLGLCLGVVGLVWSLQGVNTATMGTTQSEILTHQQEGLLNPAESTGPAHFVAVFQGIIRGIQQPMGLGLGATTMAAAKLGSGGVASSEVDLSNLFISLGIVGGSLYAYIIFLAFKSLFNLWNQKRDIIYLIFIGLLTVNIGQWLNGGLYSLCFLTWFAIGLIDQLQPTMPATADKDKKKTKWAAFRLGGKKSTKVHNQPRRGGRDHSTHRP
jgi:hypothetical protein